MIYICRWYLLILYWYTYGMEITNWYAYKLYTHVHILVPMMYTCIRYFLSMHCYTYGVEITNWYDYNFFQTLYTTHIISGTKEYMIPNRHHVWYYPECSLMTYTSYKEWQYMWYWKDITWVYVKLGPTWIILILYYIYYYM